MSKKGNVNQNNVLNIFRYRIFLVARQLRGGRDKGPATKKKRTFFYIFIYFSPKVVEKLFLSKSVSGYFRKKKKVLMAPKPGGRG